MPTRIGGVAGREQILALLPLELVDDAAHVLGAVLGTDQQRIRRVDDDEVAHPEQSDESPVAEDDVVARLEHLHRPSRRVPGAVPAPDLGHRRPTADVVPAEVAGDDGDALGLLHHPVVDGDRIDAPVGAPDRRLDVLLRPRPRHRRQGGGGARQVALDLLADHLRPPHEHAGVPEEATAGEVGVGPGAVGLLVEPLGAIGARPGALDLLPQLDVAVTRFGVTRADADGDQDVVAACQLDGPAHGGAEAGDVGDGVIGGDADHHRVLLAPQDQLRRQRDAGRGIAADGLEDEVRRGDPRRLPPRQGGLIGAGHDQGPARGTEAAEALRRLLEHRPSPQDGQELLGPRPSARRPEARALAAGHDDRIGRWGRHRAGMMGAATNEIKCYADAGVLMSLTLTALLLLVAPNAILYLARSRVAPRTVVCDDDEEEAPPFRALAAAFLVECAASVAAAALTAAAPLLPRRYGSAEAKVRIILLHGLAQNAGTMAVLARRLAALGFGVRCFSYASLAADVPAAAEGLRRLVGELQEERQGPLHLVGFGLGGLVARYCVRRHRVPGVRRLLTLGTPHLGTLAAPPLPAGLARLRPGSDFLHQLAAADRAPEQFEATAVQSVFDATILPSDNAYYPAAFNVTVRDAGHFTLLFSQRIFALVAENLEPQECLST
jgi:hypothetical protein